MLPVRIHSTYAEHTVNNPNHPRPANALLKPNNEVNAKTSKTKTAKPTPAANKPNNPKPANVPPKRNNATNRKTSKTETAKTAPAAIRKSRTNKHSANPSRPHPPRARKNLGMKKRAGGAQGGF